MCEYLLSNPVYPIFPKTEACVFCISKVGSLNIPGINRRFDKHIRLRVGCRPNRMDWGTGTTAINVLRIILGFRVEIIHVSCKLHFHPQKIWTCIDSISYPHESSLKNTYKFEDTIVIVFRSRMDKPSGASVKASRFTEVSQSRNVSFSKPKAFTIHFFTQTNPSRCDCFFWSEFQNQCEVVSFWMKTIKDKAPSLQEIAVSMKETIRILIAGPENQCKQSQWQSQGDKGTKQHRLDFVGWPNVFFVGWFLLQPRCWFMTFLFNASGCWGRDDIIHNTNCCKRIWYIHPLKLMAGTPKWRFGSHDSLF